MNPTKHLFPIAIASLSMMGASAQADLAEDNAREHKATISLKVSYEGGEDVTHKNNGDIHFSQKILTMKISNKEILQGLVEEGVIADIKGWSIIFITNDNAEVVGTYLTKKNNLPINITSYFSASSGPQIEAFKGKYIDSKDLESGTATYKSLASLMMDIDGVDIKVQGVMKSDTDFSDDGHTEEEFIKKADFTDLSGVMNEDEGLVTGSAKAAKGKKLTVNLP